MKILSVFGTRPEAIKMAPLVLELAKEENIESKVCITGQHREMLDAVLNEFNITPDFDLNIMSKGQTLLDITTKTMEGLDNILSNEKFDLILVHGDTTTTFSAGLTAFYHKTPVGHVEAGLRTWDKYSPFPEEMNRVLVGRLAEIHFAPTNDAYFNLCKDGRPDNVYVTGNTVIDALSTTVKLDYTHPVLDEIGDKRIIMMTMHRRENLGEPMEEAFKAVRDLASDNEDVAVIYPVHLNPVVQELANKHLSNHERIHLIEPLDMIDFHNFMARAHIILTDSGGVQEEAPSLGKPVLVLRETTERPEGVRAGTLKLVGTDRLKIYIEASKLLHSVDSYNEMSQASNPYGDGTASKQIVTAIKKHFMGE